MSIRQFFLISTIFGKWSRKWGNKEILETTHCLKNKFLWGLASLLKNNDFFPLPWEKVLGDTNEKENELMGICQTWWYYKSQFITLYLECFVFKWILVVHPKSKYQVKTMIFSNIWALFSKELTLCNYMLS